MIPLTPEVSDLLYLENTPLIKEFMTQDDFLWLQQWYHGHCNGDWEHGNGIHLGTIDNPGWSLTVILEETELKNKKFQQIDISRTEKDWIFCAVRDSKFEARCGVENLSEALSLFRCWAEKDDQKC